MKDGNFMIRVGITAASFFTYMVNSWRLSSLGQLPRRSHLLHWRSLRSAPIILHEHKDADPSAWRVRQLQDFLKDRRLDYTDCFDKESLIARVKSSWELEPNQEQGRPVASEAAQRDESAFPEFGEVKIVEATTSSSSGKSSLIFLHGFGDSGAGFASLVPGLLQLPEVRFLLPTAPAALGGLRSWFTQADQSPVKRSIHYVHSLIRKEIELGVAAERIFIGGFSQGGCIAVQAAMSFPDAPLGGCLALSTFLGDTSGLSISKANSRLNVLVCHGESDNIVPASQGESLSNNLREKNIPVQFKSYSGLSHSYNDAEVRDVRLFLLRRLFAHEDVQSMQKLSARELKEKLNDLNVNTVGCLDKSDLLQRAREALS